MFFGHRSHIYDLGRLSKAQTTCSVITGPTVLAGTGRLRDNLHVLWSQVTQSWKWTGSPEVNLHFLWPKVQQLCREGDLHFDLV